MSNKPSVSPCSNFHFWLNCERGRTLYLPSWDGVSGSIVVHCTMSLHSLPLTRLSYPTMSWNSLPPAHPESSSLGSPVSFSSSLGTEHLSPVTSVESLEMPEIAMSHSPSPMSTPSFSSPIHSTESELGWPEDDEDWGICIINDSLDAGHLSELPSYTSIYSFGSTYQRQCVIAATQTAVEYLIEHEVPVHQVDATRPGKYGPRLLELEGGPDFLRAAMRGARLRARGFTRLMRIILDSESLGIFEWSLVLHDIQVRSKSSAVWSAQTDTIRRWKMSTSSTRFASRSASATVYHSLTDF